MRLGVIIPTRGDRPSLLENARALLSKQTRQPDRLLVIDDAPRGNWIDTGWRIRTGLRRAAADGVDLVAIWEDDDWYRSTYLEMVCSRAKDNQLIGIDTTWYFNLKTCQIWKDVHPGRSSAHAMAMTPEPLLSTYPWPTEGTEPKAMDGVICRWSAANGLRTEFLPGEGIEPFVISMKRHREGKWCGGGHEDKWNSKWQDNPLGIDWLRQQIDDESEFEFYKSIHERAS